MVKRGFGKMVKRGFGKMEKRGFGKMEKRGFGKMEKRGFMGGFYLFIFKIQKCVRYITRTNIL